MSAERFRRIVPGGGVEEIDRSLADETPIAVEINGVGYAVLMASAGNLDDLAIGFVHAERLIDRIDDVLGTDTHRADEGVVLSSEIPAVGQDLVISGEQIFINIGSRQ